MCRDRAESELDPSLASDGVPDRAPPKELHERAIQFKELGYLEGDRPDGLIENAKQRLTAVGTPDEIVERLRQFVKAGVDLFVFDHDLENTATKDTATLDSSRRKSFPGSRDLAHAVRLGTWPASSSAPARRVAPNGFEPSTNG
jgi:hypothetical protein